MGWLSVSWVRERPRSGLPVLERAGVEPDQAVGGAGAEQAGGQRYHAYPAPPAYGAGGGQRDEREADDDAEDAVYAADVA